MWTQVSTRAIFFCGEVLGEFPGPSAPGVVKSRQEAATALVAPLLPLPGQLALRGRGNMVGSSGLKVS